MGRRIPVNKNRRKVLKALGTASVVSSGFAVTGGASRGSRFGGIAYDPYTHEILGEASAQLNQNSGEFVGNLRVNGRSYNMNQNTPHSNYNNNDLKAQSFRELTQKEDEVYNELIKAIVPNKGNITGFVRSPESLERTAFVLDDTRNGGYDRVLNLLEKTKGGEK